MTIEIVLIRTYNLSARLIHLGMFIYQLLRGLKITKCYNHTEVKINSDTYGAIGEGVKKRNWDSYITNLGKHEIIIYRIELNSDEYANLSKFISDNIDTKYEYSMFWYHFIRIFSGKWEGSKSNKEFFCYEFMIKCLNSTGKFNINPYLNPIEFKYYIDKELN